MLLPLLLSLLLSPALAIETRISGVVYEFGGTGKVLHGARVCVLEEPNRRCVNADKNGVYSIPITVADQGTTPVTVVLGELGYHKMRGPTLLLDAAHAFDPALSNVHLQSVSGPLFAAYKKAVGAAARTRLAREGCQIAGTVSDYAKAHHYTVDANGAVTVDITGFLEDTIHGFAGVKVHLFAQPWPGSDWTEVLDHGPLYTSDKIRPISHEHLTQTSGDGGFFFYNLPEGHYRVDVEDTRAGHTADHAVAFNTPLYADCSREARFHLPGVFVNLGPPALAAVEDVPMKPRPDVRRPKLPGGAPRKKKRRAEAA